jgi:hypothetical protein
LETGRLGTLLLLGASFEVTVRSDERPATGARHRLIRIQNSRVDQSGTSADGASEIIHYATHNRNRSQREHCAAHPDAAATEISALDESFRPRRIEHSRRRNSGKGDGTLSRHDGIQG